MLTLESVFIAEVAAVACAMVGTYLITSLRRSRRLLAFAVLTASSAIAFPLMLNKGLSIYAGVQIFYIAMNVLGIYRLYRSQTES